jgi:hypothetical protein
MRMTKNPADSGALPGRWSERSGAVRGLAGLLRGDSPGGRRGARAVVGFVPGRVEVLGRHTDYAGGRSLVCAIERGFLFVAAPREDREVSMREVGRPFAPARFSLGGGAQPRRGDWTAYPVTMARRLARDFDANGLL